MNNNKLRRCFVCKRPTLAYLSHYGHYYLCGRHKALAEQVRQDSELGHDEAARLVRLRWDRGIWEVEKLQEGG